MAELICRIPDKMMANDTGQTLRLCYHRIDGEVIGRLFLVTPGREPPFYCGILRVPAGAATDFLHTLAARHFVELQAEGEVQ